MVEMKQQEGEPIKAAILQVRQGHLRAAATQASASFLLMKVFPHCFQSFIKSKLSITDTTSPLSGECLDESRNQCFQSSSESLLVDFSQSDCHCGLTSNRYISILSHLSRRL